MKEHHEVDHNLKLAKTDVFYNFMPRAARKWLSLLESRMIHTPFSWRNASTYDPWPMSAEIDITTDIVVRALTSKRTEEHFVISMLEFWMSRVLCEPDKLVCIISLSIVLIPAAWIDGLNGQSQYNEDPPNF